MTFSGTWNTSTDSSASTNFGHTVITIHIGQPAQPQFSQQAVRDALKLLKRNYHAAALKMHPDTGGSTEQMQWLNQEYDRRRKILEKLLT